MRIGILTSSRADYGYYRPLLKAIQSDNEFEMGDEFESILDEIVLLVNGVEKAPIESLNATRGINDD